jgi:hypothetical protein
MKKLLMAFELLCIFLFFVSCYEPKPFASAPVVEDTGTVEGALIPFNPPTADGRGRGQVCNVSASQDPINFPVHMLCLNFSGVFNGNLDSARIPELVGISPLVFGMHLALFIIDTSNTLRWVYEAPENWKLMQDPEWSNHPNFVALSGQTKNSNMWHGYALKISNKDTLKLKQLSVGADDYSDFFLWVGDKYDTNLIPAAPSRMDTGFVSRTDIRSFIGTAEVKIVHLIKPDGVLNEICVADYRVNQDKPDTFHLPRPVDDAAYIGGRIEAPIVSPDGNWVTYHFVMPNSQAAKGTSRIYVQQLTYKSTPVFLSEGGEPHFWQRDDGTLYLTYTDAPGNFPVTVNFLEALPNVLGQTFMRKISLFSTGPPSLRVALSDEKLILVPYPMKGGMSKSGVVVATGLERGYFWVNR